MNTTVFVPDLAEFEPLVKAASSVEGVSVKEPKLGYWRIVAKDKLSFSRKQLGLRHALWNTTLTGGFCGRLTEYNNDTITIEGEI
jgi:hypothetical protein